MVVLSPVTLEFAVATQEKVDPVTFAFRMVLTLPPLQNVIFCSPTTIDIGLKVTFNINGDPEQPFKVGVIVY